MVVYAAANWLMRLEKRIEAAAVAAEEMATAEEEAASAAAEATVAEEAAARPASEAASTPPPRGLAVPAPEPTAALPAVRLKITRAAVTSLHTRRTPEQTRLAARRRRIRQHMRQHLSRYGVERLLLSSHNTMSIRDQHLDVAARYLYPIAYAVVLGRFYS